MRNLICGNKQSELSGPMLDGFDAGNLTPTGAEGPGVIANPACADMAAVYANVNGPDGEPNTADDDFTLALNSPAIDLGTDPRQEVPDVDPEILQADFTRTGARPQDGDANGIFEFDSGAIEVGHAPIAVDDGYDLEEGRTLTVSAPGVLENDTDPDHNSLTAIRVSSPSHGALSLNPDGSFTYTPTAGFIGDDTFTYKANDGHADSNVATVTITVKRVNHPPVLPPIPALHCTEGQLCSYDVDATDPDEGDVLTYSLPVAPDGMTINSSTGVIEWTPTAEQTGAQSIEVRVDDGHNGFDTQSFAVNVTAPPINHPPTLILPEPIPPCTVGQLCSMDVDATDPDVGDVLTFSLLTAPAGMMINPQTGLIQWTPTAEHLVSPTSYTMPNGYSGTYHYWDKFYTGAGATTVDGAPLSGGLGDLTDGIIATGNWNAVENGAGTGPYVGWNSVNPTLTFYFASILTFDTVRIYFDDANGAGAVSSPRSVIINGITFPVTDPTGSAPFFVDFDISALTTDELTIQLIRNNQWVFASEFTFFAVGPVPITVKVEDQGHLSDTQSFTVTVVSAPANHPPAAVDDAYDTTQTGQILLDFNDGQLPSTKGWRYQSECTRDFSGAVNLSESQALSVANGLLHLDTTAPMTTFVDAYYDRFNIIDPTLTQVFEARLRVLSEEPAPPATKEVFALFMNCGNCTGNLLHILQVGAGEVRTFDPVQNGVSAAVDTSVFHTYTLVRPAGSQGAYIVLVDGVPTLSGAAVSGTIGVNRLVFGDGTCQSRNGSAEIDFVRFRQFADGAPLSIPAPGVLGNDTDPEGDSLGALLVSNPTHGAFTLNPDGSFTYTPEAGFSGTDTLTYKANDGVLDSNVATVTITVAGSGGGNRPPQFGPLTCALSATAGLPYQCQLAASDPDAGDTLTFSLTTKPDGMAINASTGLIQWTPTAAQVEDNPVIARVTDTGGLFVEQSFTIAVASTGQTILVPNVLGKTQADATAMLVAANLQAGAIDSAYSDTAAAGLVIKQDPAPNSAVAAQSPVALTLSLGPNAVKVTVPNVIGQTQAAATTTLATAQLGTGFVVLTNNTRALALDALPTTQIGWSYQQSGNTIPETQIFSVSNEVLQQNTVGVTPDGFNYYALSGVVREKLPFALTVTARVLQEQGDPTDAFGFGFGVGFDTEQFAVGLRTNGVHDPAGSILSTTLDTTQFHEYRIEGAQGQGFRLFVDGVLIGTDKVSPRSAPAFFVFFGDASDTSNARGEIKSFSFEQGAGLVINQHPEANVQASKDSLVDLLIAKLSDPTSVPDVVGLSKASAITTLVAAKLLVGAVTEAFSDTVPQGSVISQNPPAHAVVPQRTAVDLKISRGPPTATVPDVRGKPQADAVAMLTAARLHSGAITTTPSAVVPAGRVVSHTPGAGAIVPTDSAVNLVISSGPSNPITVPDVTGKPQADAEALLLAAKLIVGDVATEVNNSVPIGRVISQNPTAGTVVSTGDAVRLVVSEEQRPPLASILVQPNTPLIVATQTQAFQAIGILQDGTSRNLTSRATWASSASGVASIGSDGVATGVAAGVTTISASLDGITGSTNLTVRAAVGDDHEIPTATITAPANDATITEPTDVKGTATDPNFLKYELALAPVGQSAFTTIATGTSQVTNGVLGKFDPTMLVNDLYTLRLTVYDQGGNTTETSIVVQVSRELKVGNFTLAFQDLSIPVSCLPITVTRTYDSRDKTPGDFGVGWRLDVQTIRLREGSREEDGKAWHVDLLTESGPFGFPIPTYTLVEDDTHKVSITLPDGKVEEFDLDPLPRTSQFQELVTTTARYTPRPGTLGSLAVPEGQRDLVVSDGELLKNDFTTLYDPPTFLYTTPDGTVFTIHRTNGVQSVQCTNGQTLTFGPNGITHSAGKGVVFTRDAQGRITHLTDPNGHVHQYAYNANRDLISYTDPENNLTKFTYNFRHGMLDIIDPRGVRAIRNEYDADGRLISSTDADGKPIIYTHDLATRTETVKDRLGHETVFKYDEKGNVVEQVDALGNRTKFTYDAFGNEETRTDALNRTTTRVFDTKRNVVSEKDPLGHETTYTYSALNAVKTITDPLLRVTTNNYDSKGNLTSTTDPLGKTTSYTYDTGGVIIQGAGNLLSTTDALNHTTHYEYDTVGNLTKETDATGHETTYTYDANGNRIEQITTKSGETLVTKFTYDALNRLTKTTYPDNSTTQTVYNAIGKQAKTIDQLGRETSYEYDNQGRLKSATYPDGSSESSTYDEEGRRKTSTDRAGRVTSYDYDELGRVTKTTHPDGAMEKTKYDAAGQVEETTDALGHATKYEYDAAGRRTKVTDALNHVTRFTYDAVGNQKTITDANGHVTLFVYDDNNRRTTVTYPDNTEETTGYDALGRTIKKTDQAGKMTQFAYDELGRLKKVTDALGQETKYTYDEIGNQLTQTDANNHTTSFAYDQLGRRIKRTLPLGQVETSDYNDVGNLTSKIDFNGKTTTYAYDAVNRLITKTPDPTLLEPPVTFTYTNTGQRASMTDTSGTTSYTYDTRDRLIEKVTPQGTLTYTYDLAGNLLSLDSSHADGVSVDYSYDTLNRLSKVTDNRLSPPGETTYAYDNVGNLDSYLYPNGVEHQYTYNTLNRLKNLTVSKVTTLTSYEYDLGPAGNRTAVTEFSGRKASYTYDDLYRLKEEKIENDPANVNGTIGYVYDPVGNRLSRTSDVPGIANQTFTYDNNDRLNTDTYDANGNTKASDGKNYDYDYENHLTEQNGGDVVIVYDGDGNRVAKIVGGVTTQYLIDDRNHTGYAQVVEEIVSGVVQRSYTYGLDLISQNQSNGVSYYGYDGHGSVRLLTDANGAVTDTYDYDAFGNLIHSTGSTPNNYLYTGEQLDPNMGFYYLRARYLNAGTGRFWTMDTFPGGLFEPTTLHRYSYVENDPVNQIDPTGKLGISVAFIPALESAVTVGLILRQHASNFIRGGILLLGISLFYRPGFALRAKGLRLLLASNGKIADAQRFYELGNKVIELGSKGIEKADEIADLVQLGLGLRKLAKSFQLITQTTTNIQVRHLVVRYSMLAAKIDGESINLFRAVARASRTEFSTLITRSIRLSFDILEAENTSIDLFHFLLELKYDLD